MVKLVCAYWVWTSWYAVLFVIYVIVTDCKIHISFRMNSNQILDAIKIYWIHQKYFCGSKWGLKIKILVSFLHLHNSTQYYMWLEKSAIVIVIEIEGLMFCFARTISSNDLTSNAHRTRRALDSDNFILCLLNQH